MAIQIQTRKSPSARRGRIISRLLNQFVKKINADKDAKVSLADFIRLLQLEREFLGVEQPREIIVSWEEPTGT